MDKKKLDLTAPNIIGNLGPKPEKPAPKVTKRTELPRAEVAPKPVRKRRTDKQLHAQSADSSQYRSPLSFNKEPIFFEGVDKDDPERGMRVSSIRAPIPTTSRTDVEKGTVVRRARRSDALDDEATHAALFLNVKKAKPNQVEGAKSALYAHIDARGYSIGMPTICPGKGCTGTVKYESGEDYCGGETCNTVKNSINVSRPSVANQQAESNLPH